MRTPHHRRLACHASLYFALPGIMSLVSLLAERLTYLWRVGFAVTAALGVLENVTSFPRVRAEARGAARVFPWVAAALYTFIVVFAIVLAWPRLRRPKTGP